MTCYRFLHRSGAPCVSNFKPEENDPMMSRATLLMTLVACFAFTFGCDDDVDGGNAVEVCKACDLQSDEAIDACEDFYTLCIAEDAGGHEECVVGALLRCGAEA
jgi:hypothetical protein